MADLDSLVDKAWIAFEHDELLWRSQVERIFERRWYEGNICSFGRLFVGLAPLIQTVNFGYGLPLALVLGDLGVKVFEKLLHSI